MVLPGGPYTPADLAAIALEAAAVAADTSLIELAWEVGVPRRLLMGFMQDLIQEQRCVQSNSCSAWICSAWIASAVCEWVSCLG